MPEEERPRGLTPRAFAIAFVMCVLYTIPLIWWMKYQWARFTFRRLPALGMHFLFLLIAIIITYIPVLLSKRFRPFSPQEYTIMYAMFWAALPLPWCAGMITYSYLFGSLRAAYKEAWAAVPEFWVPKGISRDILWMGGAPLDAFIPIVILWTFIWYLIYIFSYGIGLILKEPFLDVEKLTYPLVVPASWLVTQATTTENKVPSLFKSKKFWIAFILGWLFNFYYSPTGGGGQGAGLELLLKYPSPEPFMPYTYLRGKLPPPFTNMLICWDLDALGLGLYFLFPLDVLLTGIIFYVICYLIWPVIQVIVGLQKPRIGSGEWGIFGPIGLTPPFMPIAIADYGTWIGVGLLALWRAHKYIINSFKKAMSGGESDGLPVSHRTIWTAIIVSGIILIIFLCASGAHPVLAVWAIILLAFTDFAHSRIRGEAWPGYSNAWGICNQVGPGDPTAHLATDLGVAVGAIPGYYIPLKPEVARHIYIARGFPDIIRWYGIWNPTITCLESIKLAEETKTDLKEIMIAQIPVVLVVLPLTFLFLSMNISYFGAKTFLSDWWTGWQFAWIANPETRNAIRSGARVWGDGNAVYFYGNTLAGIVLAILLGIARARFPWFPFNPIGLLMFSVSFYGFLYGVIAYIAKFIVLKVGGTELYEKTALPIALGLFIGGYTGFYPTRAVVCYILGR